MNNQPKIKTEESVRKICHGLLLRVENDGAFAPILLDTALSRHTLSEADRGLLSVLVYGALERTVTLDLLIGKLANRPASEIDEDARVALRMGLYQLIYLEKVPSYAAVSESVSLCRARSRGFVNAVLRSFLRLGKTPSLYEEGDTVGRLSAVGSVSREVAGMLISELGEEKAETFLSASFADRRHALRVNTLKTGREELAEKLGEDAEAFGENGLLCSGSLRKFFGYEEGYFFVQGEGSQKCVEAVGAKAGESVLDLCAAPGGKTFGMAIDMENTGKVVSCDLHKNKLSLIRSGAERLGLTNVTTEENDARKFRPEWENAFDRVLCDVPCSGYGVLSEKPELRRKDPAVSEGLPAVQRAILESACRYVKEGGRLIYSTCTVRYAENGGQVKDFLSRHPDFSLLREGDVTKTGGFYVAVMRKEKEGTR